MTNSECCKIVHLIELINQTLQNHNLEIVFDFVKMFLDLLRFYQNLIQIPLVYVVTSNLNLCKVIETDCGCGTPIILKCISISNL